MPELPRPVGMSAGGQLDLVSPLCPLPPLLRTWVAAAQPRPLVPLTLQAGSAGGGSVRRNKLQVIVCSGTSQRSCADLGK